MPAGAKASAPLMAAATTRRKVIRIILLLRDSIRCFFYYDDEIPREVSLRIVLCMWQVVCVGEFSMVP